MVDTKESGVEISLLPINQGFEMLGSRIILNITAIINHHPPFSFLGKEFISLEMVAEILLLLFSGIVYMLPWLANTVHLRWNFTRS